MLCVPLILHAQTATELQNKINSHQNDIQALEAEIKQYSQQLTSIGKEKQTLQSAVQELDVSRKKVTASISLAQKQINNTTATIDDPSGDISGKKEHMEKNQRALG